MNICSKCEKQKFIVNKKYNLCDDCNYYRLNGKTKQEVYQERASQKPKKTYQIKKSPLKNNSKVKIQTQKEKQVKNKLSQLKNQIREKAILENKYFCWGCGKGGVQLDCSHILSVGQRKDLELQEENINLFCRDCHSAWESNNVVKMSSLLTFKKDLDYIKEKDERRYNKLFSQIEDVLSEGVEDTILLEYYQNNDYLISF